MDVNNQDVGSFLKPFIVGSDSATAADGSHDNVEMTGQSMNLNGDYESGKLVIGWKAALTSAATLKFGVQHQDSTDGSNWDTAVVDLAATIVKTATSSTTFNGVAEYDVKLTGAKAYRRYNITSDLSAGGTDTSIWSAVLVCLRRGEVEGATSRFDY